MSKRRLGPGVTFFPQPMTLIGTRSDDGELNLMGASWVSIVSKTPPTIAVSLNRDRKTFKNIKQNESFVVNLMPATLAVEADYCGLCSGKEVDKVAGSGLETVPAVYTDIPLLKDAPLNFECRLRSVTDFGEYMLVAGEILEIHANDSAFDATGKLSAALSDPLVYLGGVREYWKLGSKVADAYSAGKPLLDPKK